MAIPNILDEIEQAISPAIDVVKNLFTDKTYGQVTQNDFVNELKRKYPVYKDTPNEKLARMAATTDPIKYGFLKEFKADANLPSQMVPPALRDEKFYKIHPDIAAVDQQEALKTIEKIKVRAPKFANADPGKLALAVEKQWPDQFKGLSVRIGAVQSETMAEKAVSVMKGAGPVDAVRSIVSPIKKAQNAVISIAESSEVRANVSKEAHHYLRTVPSAIENGMLKAVFAIPDQNIGTEAVKETLAAGVVELGGIYTGITGQPLELSPESYSALEQRKISPEIASAAGQVIGGVIGLKVIGSLLKTGQIGASMAQKFSNPALQRFVAPVVSGAVEFGSFDAMKEAIEQTRTGRMDLMRLGKVAIGGTVAGAGFGAVMGGLPEANIKFLPDGAYRMAGAAAYGTGLAKLEGQSDTDAAIQGAVMFMLSAAHSSDVTKAHKRGAVLGARETIKTAAEAEAKAKGYAEPQVQEIRDTVVKQFDTIVQKAGGPEQVKAKDADMVTKTIQEKLKTSIAENVPEVKQVEGPVIKETAPEVKPAPEVQDPANMVSKTGRKLSPYPDRAITGSRSANISVKESDQWLIDEAISEAESRGDDYGKTLFKGELPISKTGLPQASRDMANEYIFGRTEIKLERPETPTENIPQTPIEQKPEPAIIKSEVSQNEPTNTDTGSQSGTEVVAAPVQVGADRPGGTNEISSGNVGEGQIQSGNDSGSGNEPSGNGPRTHLTNQQIEELVNSKSPKDFTTEEKLQIAEYTGAGGQSDKGASGRGLLDEYYTPKHIVQKVWAMVKKHLPNTKLNILEPSVGTGRFIENAPKGSTIIGLETNPISAKIAQILHPNAKILNRPFESAFMTSRGNQFEYKAETDLVIGNPPYGEHRGKYLGMGEEAKISKYEEYFLKRSLDLTKEGGIVAMVVPSGFMRGGSNYAKSQIAIAGDLIDAVRLPNKTFENTSIGTDILIFKKNTLKAGSPVTEEARRLQNLVNDKYFTDNPDKILGIQKERKGRFGGIEKYVEPLKESTIQTNDQKQFKAKDYDYEKEMIGKFLDEKYPNLEMTKRIKQMSHDEYMAQRVEIIKAINAKYPNFNLSENAPPTNYIEDVSGNEPKQIKPITENNAEIVDAESDLEEIPKELNDKLNENVVIKSDKKDKTIQVRAIKMSPEELAMWDNTLPTGELSKQMPGANYMEGKYYNDFNYYQGDIYRKLDQLEYDKDLMEKSQYEKQKAGLEKVLPQPADIKNIKITPIDSLVHRLKIGDQTIADMFIGHLSSLPHDAFKGSGQYEISGYVRGARVTGRDKDENRLEKKRRREIGNELFLKFIREDLSVEEQKKLIDFYNRERNAYAIPDYSKVPIISSVNATFKGRQLKLRDIQQTGSGFLINRGVGGLAWEVGGGKTLGAILSVNELMHRGWVERPLIVVPRGRLYKKWIEEIREVIPNVKINSLENLGGKFKGDLATLKIEPGTISIITYEGANRLSFKDETYNELTRDLRDAMKTPGDKTARQSEKELANTEKQIGRAMKGTTTERYFEDLGFDHVVFDEAHRLKNIFEGAKMEKGEGRGTANEFANVRSSSSTRGVKGYLISQYLMNKYNGRGVFLLSATPFTNNPIEYYSMLSLMAKRRLEQMGLKNVNDFMTAFMDMKSTLVVKADRSIADSEVIEKFKNANELRKLIAEYWDFKDGEELGVERPNKTRKKIFLNPTDLQIKYMEQANDLFADKKHGGPMVGAGELQNITISPYMSRYYEGPLPTYKQFVEDSPKIKAVMESIKQNKADKPEVGMIIYMPRGVQFHPLVKEYLIKELKYKPTEVGIISGDTTGSQSELDAAEEVMQQFNAGKVKIIIGSDTIKEGIDLQGNTTDMYVLHLPWNPSDLQQMEGRGWRHGNHWKNIRINYPLIKDSVDPFVMQKLETKEKRVKDAREKTANEIDVSDIDFEELKLQLITNPIIKLKAEYDLALAKENQKLNELKSERSLNLQKVLKYEGIMRSIKQHTEYLNETTRPEDKVYYQEKLDEDNKNLKIIEKKIEGTTIGELKKSSDILTPKIQEQEKAIAELKKSFDERMIKAKQEKPPARVAEPNDYEAIKSELSTENKSFFEKREKAVEKVVPAKGKRGTPGANASQSSTTIDKFEQIKTEQAQGEPFKIADEVRAAVEEYFTTIGERYTSGNQGLFYRKSQNARVKALNDVGVAAHEAAHSVDMNNRVIESLIKPVGYGVDGKPIYSKESLPIRKALTKIYLEYYPGALKTHSLNKRMTEGIATFIEKFVTNPTAIRAKYPMLVRDFLTTGGRYYSGPFVKLIGKMHGIIQRYQALDPIHKVGAVVTNKIRQNEIQDTFLNFKDKVITEIVDNAHPIVKLAKESGVERTIKDPSLWVRQYNSVNAIIASNMTEGKGLLIFDGDKFVKAMEKNQVDLIKDLQDANILDDFAYWLVARRVHFDYLRLDKLKAEATLAAQQITADNQAKGNGNVLGGMTAAERKEALDKIKQYTDFKIVLAFDGFDPTVTGDAYLKYETEFENYAKTYDKINAYGLRMMRSVGLITDKQLKEYSEREGYASFKRDVYDELLGAGPESLPQMRVGKTKVSSTIGRKGSKLSIINPLFSLVKDHAEIMRKVMKQQVYNKIAGIIDAFPELFQQIPLVRHVDPKTGMITYPQEKDPNIIMARDGRGVRVPILTNREVKSAIDDLLSYKNLHIFESLIRSSSRMFTKGTTGAYPLFAVSNYIVDQVTAAANTRTKFIPIYDSLANVGAALFQQGTKEAVFFKEYIDIGGERQTLVKWQDMSPDELFNAIAREKNGLERAADYLNQGLDIISLPGKWSEIVTRGAEYVKSRMAGNPQIVAFEDAGRITAPFHHVGRWGGGTVGQTLIKAIPFFNPGIQVLAQAARTLGGKETRNRALFVHLAVLASAVGSMVYLLESGSDQQKQLIASLEPKELASYLWLPHPTNKEKLIKLRMPNEMMAITTAINMALIGNKTKMKYSPAEYADAMTAFLPDQLDPAKPVRMFYAWLPQFIKPIIEATTNTRLWPNLRPLETQEMKSREPRYRFRDNTSMFAKWLGDKLNLSPIKIDYIIEGYVGRVSRFGVGKPISNPVVRDMYFTAGRQIQDYYDMREAAMQKMKAYKEDSRKFTNEEINALTKQLGQIKVVEKRLKIYREIEKAVKAGKREEAKEEIYKMRGQILDEIAALNP